MELAVKVNLVLCYLNSFLWQYKLKVQTRSVKPALCICFQIPALQQSDQTTLAKILNHSKPQFLIHRKRVMIPTLNSYYENNQNMLKEFRSLKIVSIYWLFLFPYFTDEETEDRRREHAADRGFQTAKQRTPSNPICLIVQPNFFLRGSLMPMEAVGSDASSFCSIRILSLAPFLRLSPYLHRQYLIKFKAECIVYGLTKRNAFSPLKRIIV